VFPVANIARTQSELDKARAFAVNTDEDCVAANEIVRALKGLWDTFEAQRKQMKHPQDLAVKAVQDFWNPLLSDIATAIKIMKGHIEAYLKAVEARQRALQEQADREARAAREELERAAKAAEEKGDMSGAEDLALAAQSVVAPVLMDRAPKLQGTSVREVWKFQIENPALIPREYLMPNETRIGGYVRSMRSDANIPGVRIWCEKNIAVSGKAAT